MLDFILFSRSPADKFVEWLQQQGVASQLEADDECFIISIEEDQDEALYEQIEAKYDELLEENEAEMSADDEEGYHMAAISIELESGETTYADIDPKLMGRIFSAVTPEEFNSVVEAIVAAVENPQLKTYCQRQRDKQAQKTDKT